MTSSGSVFSETLKEITDTKLDELSKRRNTFEETKASLLAAVGAEQDAIKRLRALSAGVKTCFSIKLDKTGNVIRSHTAFPQLEIELKNLDRFLSQADYDPSLSSKTLDVWERSLLRHLETQSLKFQYASLNGQLITEWLSSNDKEDDEVSSDDVPMGEAYEDVGSAQKLKAKAEWEEKVFEPANVNEATLWNYLGGIFQVENENRQDIRSALSNLRDSVYSFEVSMSKPNQFTTTSLRWVIRGLRSSDLLSEEKREVLKDFEGNEVLLNEIADVLNMRINALGSWTWSSDPSVPVELRRKISGKFDIHMHADLLQAIFLQYIGVKWSVFFKSAFTRFRSVEGPWNSARKDIPTIDKRRLGYYLGPLERSPCLQSLRTRFYNKRYFLAKLMDRDDQDIENVEGEVEVEYDQYRAMEKETHPNRRTAQPLAKKRRRLASKAARKSAVQTFAEFDMQAEEDEDDDEGVMNDGDDIDVGELHNPMALKQTVLHLLSSEMTINTRLYGEMTAFHTVFESWESLLPHETIRTVLKFFGVSEAWLGFFAKFLEAPLRFVDDDKSTPARKRRRGVPASHVLSDVVGEATLFCLDYAVNQAASGTPLWRVHDDVWFWSKDHDTAVKAWKTLEEFKTATGTALNQGKTGTVRVSKSKDEVLQIDENLPKGDIRWGFLRLSPQSGAFDIDQNMVDSHIDELREQLRNKDNSILGFVHAWNTFAGTFFTSNFGKAAVCFGRRHVDSMLSTLERIQRQVFGSFDGDDEEKISSIGEYLKDALNSRFGLTDVPDGYLYFPMEIGGLDLRSPFVSLLQIRDDLPESPAEILEEFQKAERRAYDSAHESFVNGTVKYQRYALDEPEWVPESAHDRETFMTFDEYVRYREYFKFDHYAHGARLTDVFHQLMRRPTETSVDPDSTKVSVALGQLQALPNLKGITAYWHGMDSYWRWVAMMYGPEILDRFGSLNIVDSGLLPMGMVSFLKEKRVNWQG